MKITIALLLVTLFAQAQASIKIATYNIRNFDYDSRSRVHTNKQHLSKTLLKINADLLGVQEIFDTHEFSAMISSAFGQTHATAFTTCGGAHGQKLGFVYNTQKMKLVSFSEDSRTSNPRNPGQETCHDGSRPVAIAEFKIPSLNKNLIAISVHLKSGGAHRSVEKRFLQLKIIKKIIDVYKAKGFKYFTVMGDFNSTQYTKKKEAYTRFVNVVRSMDLEDTTKDLGCSSYWWGGVSDRKQYPSLLDHILISKSFLHGSKHQSSKSAHCKQHMCKITNESEMGISFDEVSDHCPLETVIKH